MDLLHSPTGPQGSGIIGAEEALWFQAQFVRRKELLQTLDRTRALLKGCDDKLRQATDKYQNSSKELNIMEEERKVILKEFSDLQKTEERAKYEQKANDAKRFCIEMVGELRRTVEDSIDLSEETDLSDIHGKINTAREEAIKAKEAYTHFSDTYDDYNERLEQTYGEIRDKRDACNQSLYEQAKARRAAKRATKIMKKVFCTISLHNLQEYSCDKEEKQKLSIQRNSCDKTSKYMIGAMERTFKKDGWNVPSETKFNAPDIQVEDYPKVGLQKKDCGKGIISGGTVVAESDLILVDRSPTETDVEDTFCGNNVRKSLNMLQTRASAWLAKQKDRF